MAQDPGAAPGTDDNRLGRMPQGSPFQVLPLLLHSPSQTTIQDPTKTTPASQPKLDSILLTERRNQRGRAAFQRKEVTDPSHCPEEEVFFPLPHHHPPPMHPFPRSHEGTDRMWGRGAVPIFSLPHSPAKDLSPQLGLSWGKGVGGAGKPWSSDSSSPHRGWAGGGVLLGHSE